jgi:hypothetical protein
MLEIGFLIGECESSEMWFRLYITSFCGKVFGRGENDLNQKEIEAKSENMF